MQRKLNRMIAMLLVAALAVGCGKSAAQKKEEREKKVDQALEQPDVKKTLEEKVKKIKDAFRAFVMGIPKYSATKTDAEDKKEKEDIIAKFLPEIEARLEEGKKEMRKHAKESISDPSKSMGAPTKAKVEKDWVELLKKQGYTEVAIAFFKPSLAPAIDATYEWALEVHKALEEAVK